MTFPNAGPLALEPAGTLFWVFNACGLRIRPQLIIALLGADGEEVLAGEDWRREEYLPLRGFKDKWFFIEWPSLKILDLWRQLQTSC